MANSGNFNIVNQSRSGLLSGGGSATQVVTTDSSAKNAGLPAIWDASGNLVAGSPGGQGGTHTEILTDGAGNFIFANGDLIYTPGVPN